jgi:Tol biopolymer transport system component
VLFNPATQVSWYLTPRGGRVIQPAWNNNGSKIVFVRLTNGVDEIAEAPVAKSHGAWQLGVRKVLARGQIAQPAFTPDGKWVTYLRVDGNGFDMYAIRSTGGSTYKLGQVPADIDARWHPFWMP